MRYIYKILMLSMLITLFGYGESKSINNNIELLISNNINKLLVSNKRMSGTRDIKLELLSIEILENKIKIYFNKIKIDKSISLENLVNPIYSEVYYICDSNNIKNPKVEIYIDNRNLDDIIEDMFPISNIPTHQTRSNSKKRILVNPGHGYTFKNNSWYLQRPLMENRYREDFGNAILSNFLMNKLNNIDIKAYSARDNNLYSGVGVSGYEKWKENSRQYVKSLGINNNIWNSLPSYSTQDNDIRTRPLYANYLGVNLMVSIHTNAAGSTARGTQIYISSVENGYKSESRKFAQILQKYLKSEIHSKYDKNWYVSSNIFEANHGENRIARMPSVILELGFHTNTRDINALLNNTFRDASMNAIKLAIMEYLDISSNITVYDFWIKEGIIYTNSNFDAQFKLKNNSNEAIEISAVALALHDENNKYKQNFKVDYGVDIGSGETYLTGLSKIITPSKAGTYYVVAKYKNDNGDWIELKSQQIVIKEKPTSQNPIITGVGSIINPSKNCFGCDKDEAYMQTRQYSPSAVVFQWNYRDNVASCKYLNIVAREVDKNGNVTNFNKKLDVSVYTKKWSSNTNKKAYNMTLPITIDSVNSWNTILISSREPLSKRLNIKASCSDSLKYRESIVTKINADKVNSLNGYVWAGNSSIIRRDNPNATQSDGVYRDVAISSTTDKGLTYFQWQPANNCLSIKLKAGMYPDDDGENIAIKAVNMKYWSYKWDDKSQCQGHLPCTIKAPNGANGYYIIKVKTNANAIDSNKISAVCE